MPAQNVPQKYRTIEKGFRRLNEETPVLEGRLVEKGSQPFANAVVGRYTFIESVNGSIDPAGKQVTVLGSTQLDDLLEQVPEGTDVRITFEGTTISNSKRAVKQYKLEVADIS